MCTRDLLALLCVLLAWGSSVADSGTDRPVSAWHWPTNHTGSNRNRRQVAASAFEPISMTAPPSAYPQAPPEVIAPDDDEDGLLAWNWMIGSDAATKRNPSHRSANFQRYPMVRTEKPPWMPRPLPESEMKTDTVPRDFYPSTIDDYHLVFNRLNDSGFVRISTQRIYSKHQLENHNLRQVFWLCQAQWNTVNLGCNWFPQLIREATCDNPSCSGPDFKCKPIAAFQKMLRRKNGLCRTDSEMSYEPLGVDPTRTVWDLPAELRDEWVWEKRRVPIACACNGEFMEWPWDQIL